MALIDSRREQMFPVLTATQIEVARRDGLGRAQIHGILGD